MRRPTEQELARLATATEYGTRSLDPERKVGALIFASAGGIIGQGFNKVPTRLHYEGIYANRQAKLESIIHAEEAAIIGATGNIMGGELYVSRMCCAECAKLVIEAWIVKVVVPVWDHQTSWASSFETAERLFERAGVELVKV